MASRPPQETVGYKGTAVSLRYADRAALNAEVAAALNVESATAQHPTFLQECPAGPNALVCVPAQSFEDAQDFFYAVEDLFERGKKIGDVIKSGASFLSDVYSSAASVIERQAARQISNALKSSGGKYTAEVAKEALKIKRDAIIRLGKLDPPIKWLGYAKEDVKVALRAVDREGSRILRGVEKTGLAQEKNFRRAFNKIEVLSGSKAVTNLTKGVTLITVVIDVGPPLLNLLTAKDEKEYEKAARAFVAAGASTLAGMTVGELTVAILVASEPVGWVAVGVGLVAGVGLGTYLGDVTKKKIDPPPTEE